GVQDAHVVVDEETAPAGWDVGPAVEPDTECQLEHGTRGPSGNEPPAGCRLAGVGHLLGSIPTHSPYSSRASTGRRRPPGDVPGRVGFRPVWAGLEPRCGAGTPDGSRRKEADAFRSACGRFNGRVATLCPLPLRAA